MFTNVSLDDLALLAEFLRGVLKSYEHTIFTQHKNLFFSRSTIRNIARTLEKNNPFYTTIEAKLNEMITIIEKDQFYSSYINKINKDLTDKWDKKLIIA
jgi:hypothetical protein